MLFMGGVLTDIIINSFYNIFILRKYPRGLTYKKNECRNYETIQGIRYREDFAG